MYYVLWFRLFIIFKDLSEGPFSINIILDFLYFYLFYLLETNGYLVPFQEKFQIWLLQKMGKRKGDSYGEEKEKVGFFKLFKIQTSCFQNYNETLLLDLFPKVKKTMK